MHHNGLWRVSRRGARGPFAPPSRGRHEPAAVGPGPAARPGPSPDRTAGRPAGNKPSIWPSGNEPPAWPSPGPAPSWPSGHEAPSGPPGTVLAVRAWPWAGARTSGRVALEGRASIVASAGQRPPGRQQAVILVLRLRPGRRRTSRRCPVRATPMVTARAAAVPRRFPVRALIVLGLFIAFGFAVRGLTSHHQRGRGRALPPASAGLHTGLQAPPGAVGASFRPGRRRRERSTR